MSTFPVSGYTGNVNLHWGDVRGGSDIMAPRGTPVLNMKRGKVIESGWDNVGGNSVLVMGEDGNQYYYAHLNEPSPVRVGQMIDEGTYLGPVGNTGDASGGPTHLHIGIGPDIKLGSDKYGGTGGDYDAVGLLNAATRSNYDPSNAPGQRLDYSDKEAVSNYIRAAARARNIDPEIAVAVANSEGLNTYVGDNNSSFGPFQLHYGGVAAGGNSVSGLGDAFTKATGLDARNPDTLQAQIEFALDDAAANGWGAYHGAAKIGVGPYAGIGSNAKALGVNSGQGGQNQAVSNGAGNNRPSYADALRGLYNNVAQLSPGGLPDFAGLKSVPPIASVFGSPYQNMPLPSTYNRPAYQNLPYFGQPPSMQDMQNQWIQSERDWFQNRPSSQLTPLSFSPYGAPNAQPDIMSRMARPWSVYG